MVAAKALGIYCGVDKGMKSASVPVHRLGVHCLKLCELGFKVGIVRQTETKFEKAFSSANKAAPFDRRLSAIYTRGTYMAPDVAVLDDNNWLCIVNEQLSDPSSSTSCKIGILMIELSLGKLVFDSFSDNIMRSDLETRLSHFQPVEIISSDSLSSPTLKTINRYVNSKLSSTVVVRVEKIASSLFENNKVDISRIVKSFHSDTSPNISSNSPVVIRAACKLSDLPVEAICLVNAALDHFTDYRINLFQLSFSHFSTLKTNMILTAETLRALEIFQNENGGEHGSLFWLMDHTKTLMGKRMLKNWISKPLIDSSSLQNRIDCVEVFKNHDSIFKRFESTLHQLPDLEKMLAKLHMRKISPANLLSMLSAFEKIGAAVSMDAVEEELEISRSKSRAFLEGLLASLPLVFRVATRLRQCLNDTSAKENNLVNLFHHSQDFIVDVEQEESLVSWKASLDRIAQLKREIAVVEKELDSHFREVTRNLPRAISSCSFQIVSGIEFLIPIPTSLSTIVPKDWIKISQTKTIGRYHTPFITDRIKFKGLLSEQLEERSRTSFSLFLNAVNDAGFEEFRRAIDSIAVLDCLFSLARLSTTALYSKPVLQDTPLIEIKGGRHPIAERLVTDFVGNDTHISQEARCVLITGPNMAGKSSYLRQVALIVLMCQIVSK